MRRKPAYAAFPEAEHRERLDRARAALLDAGFDGCLSMAPEHIYFLGGYDAWVSVNGPQALIFSADPADEPSIVMRNVDLELALESTLIRDIHTYHLHTEDPAALIAAVAREHGLGEGRIAIETQSYALNHAFGLALAPALAPATVEDATALLGALRHIKSASEMAYMEEAAGYAAAGLDAFRRHCRPGITEIALAAEVESAMRRAGSDYWAVPTELCSGPRTPGGHAMPRERVIAAGDLVHIEFAGVAHRYHATAIHTLAAGDPGARAREIYALTRESLRAGADAIRAGVPVAEVEEASLEPLRRAGLDALAQMRFGYGIGIAYPPIWLETLQISRGIDQVMAPGMVFVLHGCLELVEEGIGVIMGGTYALGEDGLRLLAGTGDVDLEVV